MTYAAGTAPILATVPAGSAISDIVVDPKDGTVYGTQHQSGKLAVLRLVRR